MEWTSRIGLDVVMPSMHRDYQTNDAAAHIHDSLQIGHLLVY